MALLKQTLDLAFDRDLPVAIFASEGVRHALYEYLKDKDLFESDKKILIGDSPVAELTDESYSYLDEFLVDGGVLAVDDSTSEYDAILDFIRHYKDKATHVLMTAGRQGLNREPEHLRFPPQFKRPEFEVIKCACVKTNDPNEPYEVVRL
jgi:hypothetical protein